MDVGRVLDDGAWTSYEKGVLALAALAFIVEALANHVIAVAIPAMMRDWGLPRSAFSNVTAMGLFGVVIGALIAGPLADRFGRKKLLLSSILLFATATAGVALVNNIHQLLLIRILDGVGIGSAIPCASTLIAEFTPSRRRSRAINIGMTSIPIGNFLCGLLGAAILPSLGWPGLFVIDGCIAFCLFVILLVMLPESPRFLVGKPGRRGELLDLLRRLKVVVPAGARLFDSALPPGRAPISELLGPKIALTTLCLWSAFFFCLLAANTGLNWVPSLLAGHGFTLALSSTSLSAWSAGGFCGNLVGARLIEIWGSRIALSFLAGMAALAAIGVSFLPLDPSQSIVPVMIGFACEGLCLAGLTGCLVSLAAHIYPPAIKATGIGTATSISRVGAITSAYTAVAMLSIGGQAYFLSIAAAAIAALVSVLMIRQHIPRDRNFDRR